MRNLADRYKKFGSLKQITWS